VYTPTEHQQI